MDLSDYRKEYSSRGLKRSEMAPDPVGQFRNWFDHAVHAGLHEPNAMSVATVDSTGSPTQRTLLLKGFDTEGFVFFTNYGSRKAVHIEGRPQVSLLFPWITLERQVIVSGKASKTSTSESHEYFSSRPRESQLGAWISDQSAVVPSMAVLKEKLAAIAERFGAGEIPMPPFWGGYRVVPDSIEFWQGGPGRLHDRFLYRRSPTGWDMDRLSP